jgi:hypothetical protein
MHRRKGRDSNRFEDRGQALAYAYAHGCYAVPGAAAVELADEGGGETGAGAAEGVTEGDRAAVHVELLFVDAELADAGEDLGGEGLVQLDQVDLIERQAGDL